MKNSVKITLNFASIEVFEHFIVSSIDEGVSLKQRQLDEFFKIFNDYYQGKPFVSIANRVHDYNIDPTLLKSRKHPDLLGIAVVCYNHRSREVAEFEKKFYEGPFEIFDTLEGAKNWSEDLLQQYLKKAGL